MRHVMCFLDGYKSNDIEYMWRGDDPVQLGTSFHPDFELGSFSQEVKEVITNTG